MNLFNSKKILFFFLSFVFSIYTYSICEVNVEASELQNFQVSSNVGIIDSDRLLTEFETSELIQNLNDNKSNTFQATGVSVNYYLIRSGNTTNCELIAKFNATGMITNLWCDSLTVQSPSFINRKIYKTFRKLLRSTDSKTKGTVSVGTLSVPKGVRSAYLKTSGTQVSSNNGRWDSLLNFSGSISMN